MKLFSRPLDKIKQSLPSSGMVKQGIKDLPKSVNELKQYLTPKRIFGQNIAEVGQQAGEIASRMSFGPAKQTKFFQKVVPSYLEASTRAPGGIVSGVTHGLFNPLSNTPAKTVAGTVGEVAGNLYGFGRGPGKLYYKPIEAPIEQGVSRLLGPKVGNLASKVAGGTLAELGSSIIPAALQSKLQNRPFLTTKEKGQVTIPFTGIPVANMPIGGTYAENVQAGLTARGLIGGASRIAKAFNSSSPGFIKLDKDTKGSLSPQIIKGMAETPQGQLPYSMMVNPNRLMTQKLAQANGDLRGIVTPSGDLIISPAISQTHTDMVDNLTRNGIDAKGYYFFVRNGSVIPSTNPLPPQIAKAVEGFLNPRSAGFAQLPGKPQSTVGEMGEVGKKLFRR